MGQNAGGTDDQDRIAQGLIFALAGEDAVARGEGQLHAVGEADHHDQRRHHVEEHVEPEIEPTERAEGEKNGDERRPGGDDHEGDAPEEQYGDEAAGDEAGDVVDEPVALDRRPDLKLHDRNAGEFGLEDRRRPDRPPSSCGFP